MKSIQHHIVITGVTRGCGRALIHEFVKSGHVVLGCARSEDQVLQLKKLFPAPHHFEVIDVSQAQQVKEWAGQLLKDYPAPDFLINNAGVINRNARFWEITAEEFDEVIDVNIKGTANTIRYFLPAMIARRRGIIVNFSSGWGRSTSPQVAPYCASKWAVEGLTQAIAQELPAGMAAYPLNPGIIQTEMLQACFGSEARLYPLPEEWAKKAASMILTLGTRQSGTPKNVYS